MKRTQSAGVIVVHIDKGEPKVLLMKSYSFWDFPKGGIEDKENKLQAALREVKEEAGLTCLSFDWGKSYYETEPFGRNRKVVFYFLARTDCLDVKIEINPQIGKAEHDEFKWVSFDEARSMTVERIQKALGWAENRIKNIYKNVEQAPSSPRNE